MNIQSDNVRLPWFSKDAFLFTSYLNEKALSKLFGMSSPRAFALFVDYSVFS